jgi:hypothetical protein
MHDSGSNLRSKHSEQSFPEGQGCSTVDDMHYIRFGKSGDKDAENQLVPLAPHEIVWVDNSCSSSSVGTRIRYCLSRGWIGAIKESLRILSLDISENLCLPRHEVSFRKLDMEIWVHVWDGKDNLLGGLCLGLNGCRSHRGDGRRRIRIRISHESRRLSMKRL